MTAVSCKVSGWILELISRAGLSPEHWTRNLPVTVDQLHRPDQRIDWDLFATLCERLETLFGGSEPLLAAAREFAADKLASEGPNLGGGFTDQRQLFWVAQRWLGPSLFPHLIGDFTELPDGRVRQVLEIPPETRPCPQLFRLVECALASVPRLLGRPPAPVEAEYSERRATYTIGLSTSALPTAETREQAIAHSQRLLERIARASPEIIFVFDVAARAPIYFNDAVTSILGYTPEQLKGRKIGFFEELIHPDDNAAFRRHHERALRLADGEVDEGEYRLRHASGEWRWLHFRNLVLSRNEDGAPRESLGIARDITDRVQAAETLRESEERLRAIAENSRDLIAELDPKGKLLFITPNARDVLGYSAEELLRTADQTFVHADDLAAVAERIAKISQTGESTQLSFRARRRDGGWRWMDATATAYHGASGEVRCVVICRDITDRLRIERDRQRLVSVVENSSELIAMISLEGRIVFLNRAGQRLLGLDTDTEARSKTIFDCLTPEDAKRSRFQVFPEVHRTGHWEGEYQLRHFKTGEPIATLANVFIASHDGSESSRAMAIVARDISERKFAEEALRESREQLLQAQKMEAIGRLAGGVSHDFNNLLTAITGYCDLLLDEIEADHPLRADAEEIIRAAERAGGLTRQLLAFSRRQVLQPRVLDLNALVANVDRLLRRLIGEDVELLTSLEGDLFPVKGDPGQLEQLIMNLAVNARDAMPRGGHLTIATGGVEIGADGDPGHPGIPPGHYVTLAIVDTGVGMDAETTSRIFEPFFTTKDAGRGTGLGLSTVYGIVQQSGGQIRVDSKPGVGSTFTVYLPRSGEELDTPDSHAVRAELRGSETVLLVEDSEPVRKLVRRYLEKHGYTVLDAPSAVDALRLVKHHEGPLDLLVSDVVLPKMDGRELADRLLQQRPGLKVLYMSGFSDDALSDHGVLDTDVLLVQKPFAPPALLRKIRDALDAGGA